MGVEKSLGPPVRPVPWCWIAQHCMLTAAMAIWGEAALGAEAGAKHVWRLGVTCQGCAMVHACGGSEASTPTTGAVIGGLQHMPPVTPA